MRMSVQSNLVQVPVIVLASVCAAVLYGIIHDQVTARICVEYFTIGHPRLIDSDSPTVLGLFWGVVATWWVGLPMGIGLAIAARAGRRSKLVVGQLLRSIAILLVSMFGIAIVAGAVGFLAARAGVVILVDPLASRIPAEKHVAYLTDAWAHTGSYLAGFVGGVILWIGTWRHRQRKTEGQVHHC